VLKCESMSKTTGVSLSNLVRHVLPKLQGRLSWDIDVVERTEDAGVFVEQDVAVVRIQKGWRQTIYDSGLSRVTRHYPLALTPLGPDQLPIQLWNKGVRLWRGTTIELDYRAGLFTGELSVGQAYVAMTIDRLGLHAHLDPVTAGKKACSERRSKLRALAEHKKTLTSLQRHVHAVAIESIDRRTYDPAFKVSLDRFRGLLPSQTIRLLEEYDREFVPLSVLERESSAAILQSPDHLVCSLIYELELAISTAQRSRPPVCQHFTDDEIIALGALAQS
jgi:hypothetical protein